MKLWQKHTTKTSALVEAFTTGRDREMDLYLAPYDVLGSLAHVKMLTSIQLLTAEEGDMLTKELRRIYQQILNEGIELPAEVEDIHSYMELLLTQLLGDTGKKIHAARSRNDQVLVDIRLFLRQEVEEIVQATASLFELLQRQSEQFKHHLMPGYTHLQLAMPSSFGLWFGAYAESLVDDMVALQAAYQVINKNPLGSAAGYGSSFPVNRTLTTALLGFDTLNYNVVYAQMSRGKSERITAAAIASLADTLARISMDACLFLNQEFNFISFPAELTTGSSIMPHKKNPDVFELIRAKCNRIQSTPNELTLLTNNLPSGYHRDMQLTKEILFPAIKELHASISMMKLMLSSISIKENILQDEKYAHLFSVEAVNELVNKGIPFRDAYAQVGNQIEKGEFKYDSSRELHHTHEGSIGNLCNKEIIEQMK
jgi:argininosuccinate lyase